MTELLQHEEDLVVRLAAAQTLKDAVDDFEFCPETFMPFLPGCFSQLFRLLREARECDTKMQVRSGRWDTHSADRRYRLMFCACRNADTSGHWNINRRSNQRSVVMPQNSNTPSDYGRL